MIQTRALFDSGPPRQQNQIKGKVIIPCSAAGLFVRVLLCFALIMAGMAGVRPVVELS